MWIGPLYIPSSSTRINDEDGSEDELVGFEALIMLIVALFIIWLLVTVFTWAAPFDSYPPQTLVHVIAEQWRFLASLTHRIW